MKRFQFNYLALLPATILASYLAFLNLEARFQKFIGLNDYAVVFTRGWPFHYQEFNVAREWQPNEVRLEDAPRVALDVGYLEYHLLIPNALIILLLFALTIFICQKILNRLHPTTALTG